MWPKDTKHLPFHVQLLLFQIHPGDSKSYQGYRMYGPGQPCRPTPSPYSGLLFKIKMWWNKNMFTLQHAPIGTPKAHLKTWRAKTLVINQIFDSWIYFILLKYEQLDNSWPDNILQLLSHKTSNVSQWRPGFILINPAAARLVGTHS